MMNVSKSESVSVFDAPTIIVQDEFTTGGAQRKGGSEARTFSLNQDLDYVRGLHSWRAGIMLDGGYSATSTSTNYLGTYTFENLDAYLAGRPRSYSIRTGNPNVSFWNVQTALYVQDDYRPRKNLSISLGMRYEMQTRVQDRTNIAPRAGFTWSPLKSGRMSVRGSWGIFYDWFNMGTYAQTLQTDGTRQREVNIINPSYPNPGALGASAPINRYLLEDRRKLPQHNRASFGVSGSIKRLSLGATYSHWLTSNVLVGENLNAPVNGVRPDPLFANIIRAVGVAEAKTHSVSGNVSVNLSPMASPGALPMPPGANSANQKFFSLRRNLFVSTFFGINRSRNNSDGAFAVPASGDLSQEWGPSFGGLWNVSTSISTGMIKNLSVNLGVYANAGSYYTIRTGFDDNGDLIFNDRPAGVGRNTERGTAQINGEMFLNYTIGFGRQTTTPPMGGVMIMERGGAMSATMMQMPAAPRYRLNIGVIISNPTNRANYGGYNGVMTSKLFRQPTSASGVRTIRFNMGLSF
jgi:hypothetical protein